jgi:DNA-binding beta-propeller fold protein YncE
VPEGVVAVDADPRSTWVLNDVGAHRLALAGGPLRQAIDGRPVAVEIDGDRVWVLDVVGQDLVLGSFDVEGGPEVLEEPVGPAEEAGAGRWRGALAVSGDEVWVSDGSGAVARRLPGETELQPVDLDGDVVDLAMGGPWLWAGTEDGRVLRIDRSTPQVTSVEVATGPVVEVVAGDDAAWVADDDGEVRRVSGDVAEAGPALPLDPGRKVLALTPDGAVLYVANAEDGTVERVDTASGRTDPGTRIDLTTALG